MPQGIGDRLLRDPEDSGVDRRREGGQVTRDRHLHPRPGRRGPGQPLEVGHTGLRGVVGGRLVAQHAHHRPHLGQRARRLLLDHLQRLERRRRAGRREGAPGLGLDGDGRDVVGHRVVQLARQQDPLLRLHLLEPPFPGAVLGAHGPAQGEGGHQRRRPRRSRPPTPVQLTKNASVAATRMIARPADRLAPGAPPEERVGQHRK